MEKTSPKTLSPSSFILASFVGSLLFHRIHKWVLTRIQIFYSSFLCFLQFQSQSQFDFIFDKSNCQLEKKFLSQKVCFNEEVDDGKLSKEDVEMVMGKLKIDCNPNGEKLQERLGLDEFSLMFEEKEPSVEEMKGAFDVFDENRDGYVDTTELQKVLSSLGFKEGSEVHECERMIKTYDDNGDGRIDFNEFVKLMEKSFF